VNWLCACVLSCSIGAATVSSQAPLQDVGDDTRSLQDQISKAAAQIQRERTEFVSALLQFSEAVGGSYGDEGPVLLANADAMARALIRWDRAIQSYRSILTDGPADNASVHVALAAVYLERGKADEARKEATAASRLDPSRSDAYILQALAHDLSDRPVGAAQALERAAPLAKDNPSIPYELARRLAATGDDAGAKAALRKFYSIAESDKKQDTETRNRAVFVRTGLLRQSAGIAPMFPPFDYAQGYTYLAQGAYEKAASEFSAAARRDPLNNAETARDEGIRDGARALHQADLPGALDHFKAAVTRHPDSSEARRMLGLAYKTDEQYAESVEQLKAAVMLNPLDDRARIAFADALILAEHPDEAEAALKDAAAALPRGGRSYYQLALLYQSRGQLGLALNALEKASSFEPPLGQDYLYDTLGGLYMSNADLDGAQTAYRKRVAANPNNSDAHRKLGQVYLEQGHYDEARAEFAAAVLIDPLNAEAHVGRAQVHLRSADYESAERAARRALALNPSQASARYALGASLVRVGRVEEGARELDEFRRVQAEGLAKANQEWELKLIRQSAQIAVNERDFDRAAALLNRAAAMGPDAASNYTSLGLVLEQAGRHAEAIDAFHKALEKRAGPEVHRYLARAYAAAGRHQESEAEQEIYNRVKRDRMLEGNRGR
jgi:tetratricopeptide (TPR) repeat protein